MDIIQRLGSEGKSVVVSSHVLHEVQSLTPNIILLNRRTLVASNVRDIRDLIDKHPHHIVLICDEYKLAGRILEWDDVEGVRVLAREQGLMVETRQPDAFYSRLPARLAGRRPRHQEVYSDDDSLESALQVR